MTTERRRTSRIDVVRHATGVDETARAHVRVKEISLGGMLIETNADLSPLGDHEFRLRLSDGGETVVRGRVVHGHFAVKDGAVMYTLGIEFSFVPAASAEVIRRFVLETRADPFPVKSPSPPSS